MSIYSYLYIFIKSDGLLFSVYSSVSSDTTAINQLFFLFLLIGGALFLAIVIWIWYIIKKFKHTNDDIDLIEDTGNKKVEIGITVASFIVILVFIFLTVKTMSKISPIEIHKNPDLIITGHQWWWEFNYPKLHVETANELHIPAGKRMLVQLQSADVIHDWWVPALGRKMDMIPGQNNFFYIESSQVGIFEGACSEFCGRQHAWMRIKVFADDSSTFVKWVQAQRKPAQSPKTELAEKGKILFETKTCSTCHQINGVSTSQSEGPNLSHIASRTTLFTGKNNYSFENLKLWIANPQQMKPGVNMPDFILSDEEVLALATYLNQLN
jgi:cytochrome c oxidase subunit 2